MKCVTQNHRKAQMTNAYVRTAQFKKSSDCQSRSLWGALPSRGPPFS